MLLPDIVDDDTVLFAPAFAIRAGSVRPVADELLAAANAPDRLRTVDPTTVRVRAADLLSQEHDPALLGDALDDAVAILRQAAALALPGEIAMARDVLAKTLAEQGNLDELDALVRAVLREPASSSWAFTLLEICAISTVFGYGQQAVGWLDEALAAAAAAAAAADGRPPGRTGRNRAATTATAQASTIRAVLQDAGKRLAKVRAVMTADGCDPDDPAAARARMRTRPAAAATVNSYPPWPAGCTVR